MTKVRRVKALTGRTGTIGSRASGVLLARISHRLSQRGAERAVLARLETEAPAVVLVQYVEEAEERNAARADDCGGAADQR